MIFMLFRESVRLRRLLGIAYFIDTINEWVGRLTYWLVLVMVGIGVWNVIGRYLGKAISKNLTSNALIETQWYLFSVIFLLGAAYALKHNEHVRVDIFYKGWSAKKKAIVNLIGSTLFLMSFAGMIIYFSIDNILNSWEIKETSPDPGGLPRYPIKAMILVSFALLVLQGIAEAIKNWAIITNHITPPEVTDDTRI